MNRSIDYLISFIREDRLQCTSGNKPCGKRCIPEKQNCTVETAKMAVGGAVAGGALGYNLAGPLGAAYGGAGGLVGGGLVARGHSQRTISIAANLAGVAGAATLLSVASKARSGEASSGGDEAKRQKAQEDYEKKVQEEAQNEAYKTMGIKKGATPDEVRTAYKAAARKYHPDINKDPKAAEKFAKINAAMDILDPKRKAKADESQADNAKRAEQGAKRARVRFNSLQVRIDSFMFLRLQEAYKTIQQDFPDIAQDFWYSR